MMAKAEIMPTSVATNPTLAWVPKAAAAAIWSGPQLSIGRPLGAQSLCPRGWPQPGVVNWPRAQYS